MKLILKKKHYAWVFRGKFSRKVVGVGRLMCGHDKCLGSPNSVHGIVIWGGTAECQTCTCSENLPHRWTRRGDTVNEASWFSYLVLTNIEFLAFFLHHSRPQDTIYPQRYFAEHGGVVPASRWLVTWESYCSSPEWFPTDVLFVCLGDWWYSRNHRC